MFCQTEMYLLNAVLIHKNVFRNCIKSNTNQYAAFLSFGAIFSPCRGTAEAVLVRL